MSRCASDTSPFRPSLPLGRRMSHVLWRLLVAVPTLFGVVVVTFLITRVLPGDPAAFFASNPSMTAADIAAVRVHLGLDQSLWTQFVLYLDQVAHGDLGHSVTTGQSVAAEFARRLPASAELTLAACALAVMIALPLGLAAALKPGSGIDHVARGLAALGNAMPAFVTGLLLIHLFYVLAGIAPEPIGRLDPYLAEPARVTGFLVMDAALAGNLAVLVSALRQLVLPAAAMALFALAPLLRMTRAAMIEVLASDHIRAARAAGISPFRIVAVLALRNALVPVLTTGGVTFSYMLGANVLIEQVFSWPGIGAFAVSSVLNLDYAPLQGFMLVVAALFILVNVLVDIACAIIDPRAGV